jgi:hypothetical protein
LIELFAKEKKIVLKPFFSLLATAAEKGGEGGE